MKSFLAAVIVLAAAVNMWSQIDARILRHPDVSETQITFVYGGDVWVVNKEGGLAVKLSSPQGAEAFPKFSPDGSQIAYTANYEGNYDIYVIPSKGGVPSRITYHGNSDRVLDWYPSGKEILYGSSRESGRERFNQLYKVSVNGGLSEKLPLPYGEFATISDDGDWLAYTNRTRMFRTWKRYRGGMAADIWLFNLKTYEWQEIAKSEANDELPMWHGKKIYFLSDRGNEKRYNIWSYDTQSKQLKQVTEFKDYDVHFPSMGPKELVFEAGGKLWLLDLATDSQREVKVSVITDQLAMMPKKVNVKNYMMSGGIAPDGKRVTVMARGDIFSLPAKDGVVKNLTSTSGVAERFPAWSPNGKYIAYWSDKTGEYELALFDLEKNTEKIMTDMGPGYRYNIFWSPNSEMIAFVDQTMKIWIYNIKTEKLTQVDKAMNLYEGGLNYFNVSWSSDSKWMAYSKDLQSQNSAVFLYDVDNAKLHQVTSGFYSDSFPVFDPDGKYLYLATNRNFSPLYSDFDNTFVYPNSTKLAVIALRKDVSSPLAPKNDVTAVTEEKKEEAKDEKKEEKKDEKKEDKAAESLKIDIDGFESRLVLLPVDAGNIGKLAAVSGKLLFHRAPNSGSESKTRPLKYYDLSEREEKTIMGDVDGFALSANGKKLLVMSKSNLSVIDVAPEQKMKDMVPTSGMEAYIVPKEEWKQIFTDAWRLQRDFFYDKNMHGVDWDGMKERYMKLIDVSSTRLDVDYVIGELIGELNASHTYKGGGDMDYPAYKSVGYLGVDWALDNGAYKIKRIVRGAPWDAEVRSPLDMPGVDVKEGDYVLEVNGVKIDPSKDPYASFQGLGGQTVELTVNSKPTIEGSKKVVVELLNSEFRLRNLEWQENFRKRVEEATGGEIGYIHVRSTGIDGQDELIRQFHGQRDKKGLIIDERFNNGGQIPDRFVELLNRKALAYFATRDGATWQWPPSTVFGPKVMLINGWSGSGGDAFPDYFRKSKIGPLIGMRTWGGLIGLSGTPPLIDGGTVTVPTFRQYDPDGKWFKEGYGVDPDIEVIDDPSMMAKGVDPQLERAITEVMKLLKENPQGTPEHAPYEKR
ncbi:MAG: PDZ domain-containing protein [Ignavibacteriaceae bacterium]|nr:PDZ domain-containing protein [Ignavibacteriaceae bacterium]